MTELNEAMENLMEAVRHSDAFVRYQAIREKVHGFPELERKITEFRKKNYQIQNSGGINLFDEVDRLERENSQLRRNPVAEEFYAAELAFCRVYQKISWSLTDQLNFEVGFGKE